MSHASLMHAALAALTTIWLAGERPVVAEELRYSVSWLGNSFSGADDKWVQNFFIHTKVRPDGTVNTWSHWDEGGRRFGVYRDGDVIGNAEVDVNSLETVDHGGRRWRIEFDYVEREFHEYDIKPKGITCDGVPVTFPGLCEPTALAVANDGQLMVADSLTSPRQQVLFYDITESKQPKLTRAFGDYGGIRSGKPGEVAPAKFWGIRGVGMDAAGNRETVSFESAAGREAACVAAAGDYVFTGGWKERGRIFVNRLSDGVAVGTFDPGPTVGGVENTGWIDILTGISAHRRADGEYLVFVEEDYKAKVLLYRWKP